MRIFYFFDLKVSKEYQAWRKLRGKLFSAGYLPDTVPCIFSDDGRQWAIMEVGTAVLGYYVRPPSRTPERNIKAERAVLWMYDAPGRTYADTVKKFKIPLYVLQATAKAYRATLNVEIDRVGEIVHCLMAEYLERPIKYSLKEYAAKYGIAGAMISRKIREYYRPEDWPSCIRGGRGERDQWWTARPPDERR